MIFKFMLMSLFETLAAGFLGDSQPLLERFLDELICLPGGVAHHGADSLILERRRVHIVSPWLSNVFWPYMFTG